MSWEPTNELRWVRRGLDLSVIIGGPTNMFLQQKWLRAVPPEHDGATGYFEEQWRDVPVVDE